MTSSAAKWREDQVLIVCPGSRTTMAQLGCSELTPPSHRIPTRMFRDGDEWRAHHTFKRARMGAGGVERDEWVEDVDSEEGAVFPIEGGRIVNMEALLAFLDHVHGLLTSTYHNTPIMLMASPQWTRSDCEAIAQYVFEKTRTPALCLIHSAIATQYGLKWPSMTVVDIGFEKVDVTAIHDGRVVNHVDLGSPNPVRQISGGEVFTQSLLALLRPKGFTHEMAEQLKRSQVCEVLPYAPAEEMLMELPRDEASPQAAAPDCADVEAQQLPAKPAAATTDHLSGAADAEPVDINAGGGDDGVLNVAAIVTSGQTKEFLARKEKEREKGKPGRKFKDKDTETAATKAMRLPNSKRMRNAFVYDKLVVGQPDDGGTNAAPGSPAPQRLRREIEVGLERFTFAARSEIDRIATAIYRTVQSIDDMYMRPACWDSLVFVGNGARLRGLRENIVQTLQARHLVSPSTATMFTSELPSSMATAAGTGAQTPTGGSLAGPPLGLAASGVNPLLQAATTASSLAAVGFAAAAPTPVAGYDAGGTALAPSAPSHHFHSQTPTSIKTAALPAYLSEWTKNGFEEAMFLGAQVAARIAFCLHSNLDAQGVEAQRLMSLSRADYNELGPRAIRTHSMLG